MIGVLTVLFFTGESWLGGGWYYIPDGAITIALIFCIFWQIALITGTFFLSMRVNKIFLWVEEKNCYDTDVRGRSFSFPVSRMELAAL